MRIKATSMFDKVKLFTHYDLDGVGCAILGTVVFNNKIDIEMIDANSSDEIINNWLNGNIDPYNEVIITDLSVNQDTATRLNNSKLICTELDHHDTATKWFDWITVIDDCNWCGTNLFYKYLINRFMNDSSMIKILMQYKNFVNEVHMYDNWLWVDANDDKANNINNLLKILGKSRFIDRFTKDPSIELSPSERALLKLKYEEIDRYVYSHTKNPYNAKLTYNNNVDYNCSIVFADNYTNEVAHKLLESDNINVAIVINLPNTISFRSKPEVNLTELTTYLGGGGHPVSGGAPISYKLSTDIINYIFNSNNISLMEVNNE